MKLIKQLMRKGLGNVIMILLHCMINLNPRNWFRKAPSARPEDLSQTFAKLGSYMIQFGQELVSHPIVEEKLSKIQDKIPEISGEKVMTLVEQIKKKSPCELLDQLCLISLDIIPDSEASSLEKDKMNILANKELDDFFYQVNELSLSVQSLQARVNQLISHHETN